MVVQGVINTTWSAKNPKIYRKRMTNQKTKMNFRNILFAREVRCIVRPKQGLHSFDFSGFFSPPPTLCSGQDLNKTENAILALKPRV